MDKKIKDLQRKKDLVRSAKGAQNIKNIRAYVVSNTTWKGTALEECVDAQISKEKNQAAKQLPFCWTCQRENPGHFRADCPKKGVYKKCPHCNKKNVDHPKSGCPDRIMGVPIVGNAQERRLRKRAAAGIRDVDRSGRVVPLNERHKEPITNKEIQERIRVHKIKVEEKKRKLQEELDERDIAELHAMSTPYLNELQEADGDWADRDTVVIPGEGNTTTVSFKNKNGETDKAIEKQNKRPGSQTKAQNREKWNNSKNAANTKQKQHQQPERKDDRHRSRLSSDLQVRSERGDKSQSTGSRAKNANVKSVPVTWDEINTDGAAISEV